MNTMDEPGTYILVIKLDQDRLIRIGRLGEFPFQAGYYLYVGSALNGLRGRLARHLRATKRLHWHIDYLLQYAQVVEVWYYLGSERHECTWVRALAQMPGVRPFEGPFGASDCSCRTHLFYGTERPTAARCRALIGEVRSIRAPCFDAIGRPC